MIFLSKSCTKRVSKPRACVDGPMPMLYSLIKLICYVLRTDAVFINYIDLLRSGIDDCIYNLLTNIYFCFRD